MVLEKDSARRLIFGGGAFCKPESCNRLRAKLQPAAKKVSTIDDASPGRRQKAATGFVVCYNWLLFCYKQRDGEHGDHTRRLIFATTGFVFATNKGR